MLHSQNPKHMIVESIKIHIHRNGQLRFSYTLLEGHITWGALLMQASHFAGIKLRPGGRVGYKPHKYSIIET